MSQDTRLAIAAHMHLALRRKLGRVVDTQWLAANVEYADEIIKLCRAQEDEDLQKWASKLDAAMRELRPRKVLAPPVASAPEPATTSPASLWPQSDLPGDDTPSLARRVAEQRYVGRLR